MSLLEATVGIGSPFPLHAHPCVAKFRKDKEETPMGLVTDSTRDEREPQSTLALDGVTGLRWIIVTAGIVSV